MSTPSQKQQQTSPSSKLSPIDRPFWKHLDKLIDFLATHLALTSVALNITIILNIIYCLLFSIATFLLSVADFLTTSENIIGFIAIIYCTEFLRFGFGTIFEIAWTATEEGDKLALERLLQSDGPVVKAVVEPVLETIRVHPYRPVYTYLNLT